MRFRTQMLLAFVPIFLLLGVSGETVGVLLDQHELRWGLNQEAGALAVAISEFLRDRPFTDPHPAAAGPINWEESLRTILGRHQARRLYLLAADGRTVVRHFGAAAPGAATPAVPAPVRRELTRAAWELSDFVHQGRETVLRAYAPLRPAGGRLAGYLEVEIGAEEYDRAIARSRRTVVAGSLLSALAGLAVVGLVVFPVARGTRDLRATAGRAQAGHALAPPKSRFIQEIGDLGETFGTMGTLLNEAMDKTRRTLVENEQLRTARDLAEAFHRRFDPPVAGREGTVAYAARTVGPPGGAFVGVRRLGDTLWLFAGIATGRDELQQAVAASAARRLLADALSRAAPEAAFDETAAIVPLTFWTCAAWPLAGGPARVWTRREGRPVATAAPDPDRPWCLHTFAPARQPVIDTCLAGLGDLAAADIADNLGRLLGDDAGGAFLIVRPAVTP